MKSIIFFIEIEKLPIIDYCTDSSTDTTEFIFFTKPLIHFNVTWLTQTHFVLSFLDAIASLDLGYGSGESE